MARDIKRLEEENRQLRATMESLTKRVQQLERYNDTFPDDEE